MTFLYKRFLWVPDFHLKLFLNMIFTYKPLNTFDTLLLISHQKSEEHRERGTEPPDLEFTTTVFTEPRICFNPNPFTYYAEVEECNTTPVKLEGWNISQVCCILWLWGNNAMFDKRLMIKNAQQTDLRKYTALSTSLQS